MSQFERFERASLVVLVQVERCATPAIQDRLEAQLLCRVKLVRRRFVLLLYAHMAYPSILAQKKDTT